MCMRVCVCMCMHLSAWVCTCICRCVCICVYVTESQRLWTIVSRENCVSTLPFLHWEGSSRIVSTVMTSEKNTTTTTILLLRADVSQWRGYVHVLGAGICVRAADTTKSPSVVATAGHADNDRLPPDPLPPSPVDTSTHRPLLCPCHNKTYPRGRQGSEGPTYRSLTDSPRLGSCYRGGGCSLPCLNKPPAQSRRLFLWWRTWGVIRRRHENEYEDNDYKDDNKNEDEEDGYDDENVYESKEEEHE